MAVKEKKELKKENWVQRFTLVGKATITDFTFRLNEQSEKSDWVYNSLNLGVNCGEKSGIVGCELMGGYGSERSNYVYAFGKKEDGSIDFDNNMKIAWEDRFDEDILGEVHDLYFIKVGIEEDVEGKTYVEKFLSPYDAIAYIHDHLKKDMVIRVNGNMKYSIYDGRTQCRKEVNSIYLAKDRNNEPLPEKEFKATFMQSVLLDKDSVNKNNIDKDKSSLMIDGYILEKFREYNGHDLTEDGKVKGGKFVPLRKTFEFPVDLETEAGKKKATSSMKYLKPKKGVTQINFTGHFVESGATVKVTEEDIPEEIKLLIECGMKDLEEALADCAGNGSKEKRMLLTSVAVTKADREKGIDAKAQKYDERYSEEDLILDYLIAKEEPEKEEEEDEGIPFEEVSDEDSDWLDQL